MLRQIRTRDTLNTYAFFAIRARIPMLTVGVTLTSFGVFVYHCLMQIVPGRCLAYLCHLRHNYGLKCLRIHLLLRTMGRRARILWCKMVAWDRNEVYSYACSPRRGRGASCPYATPRLRK